MNTKEKECALCLTAISKYRCPKCNIRTCSLNCSSQHKERNSCSGMPNPTSFLDKKDLLTVQSLDRDYNFLSGIEFFLDSSVKNRLKFPSNYYALKLKKSIEKCGIKYLTVPRGMSRAYQNKTFWNKRKKIIFWTIEWIYMKDEFKISNIEHKIPSNINIMEAYKIFIHKKKIKELLNIDYQIIQFMIKKNNYSENDIIYKTLDKNIPLSESLKGITILEFPTIHIIIKEDKNKIPLIPKKKIIDITNTNTETSIKNGIVDYDSEE